jgi:trehalose 6-phosphate phosphatase
MSVHRQTDISTFDGVDIAATSLASDLRACALLLDIDGTILDIAPAPQEIWVPPALRHTLARLKDLTGGALALVSGRKLDDIDLMFAPLQLAAIGGHGAEIRSHPGAKPKRHAPSLGADLKRELAALSELGPGILIEDKGYALALHYRLAPHLGPALQAAIADIFARAPHHAVDILPGKFVFEVKPAGVNKGKAVSELMQHAPFADRHPIFIGDDTTDEPVFGVLAEFGGVGFSVGRIIAGTDGHFDTPADVRAWLARIVADRGDATVRE